jgi:hypothetical protein
MQHTWSDAHRLPVSRRPHRLVAASDWSSQGRDAHFAPGWWILPAMVLGLAIWAGFFSLIF